MTPTTESQQKQIINLVPEGFAWYIHDNQFEKLILGPEGKSWLVGAGSPDTEGEVSEELDMKEVMWKGDMVIRLFDGDYTDLLRREFVVKPDDLKEGNVTRGHLLAAIREQMLQPLTTEERDALKMALLENDSEDSVSFLEGWLEALEAGESFCISDLGSPDTANMFDSLEKDVGNEYFSLVFSQ